MTEAQRIFCDEYIKDTNGSRAYKIAYPHVTKDNTAKSNAYRLLQKENIKKYIREQLDRLHDERTADTKEVLEYLTSVMRGESRSSVLALDGDGTQAVVSKSPDEKERLTAAKQLVKILGLEVQKVELDGGIGLVKIIDDI